MTGSASRDASALVAAVAAALDRLDVSWEPGRRDGELVLTLPGDHKLRTLCSLVVSGDALSLSAFVVRQPDENHEAVYRYLLARNLRLPGVAYAIDADGDVFLTGRVRLPGGGASDPAYQDVSRAHLERVLDELLGAVLTGADGAFDELLALGFVSSIRREWAWRTSRGEPTGNLDAFRHLLTEG